MEAADHVGGGAAGLLAVTEPVPVLRRQLSYNCSRGRCEPMHDRKLSHSYSFSSAVASLPSPASNKSSCESIPVPGELEKKESFSSSASSYESFFQFEAADLNRIAAAAAAATQAPAVQTMTAAQEGGSGGGYDPRRLPSSIFRTQSSSPSDMVHWGVTSNDSLFSIKVPISGDLRAVYNDSGHLYYDAAAGGFNRLPSAEHEESWRLSSVSERLSNGPDIAAGGGLCVSDGACSRCSTGGKNRRSVRFASAAEIVSGESRHSAVSPTLADALGEAPATEGKTAGAVAQGWCAFRCCWPSPPTVWWWPRCGCSRGCGVFSCGEYCRC